MDIAKSFAGTNPGLAAEALASPRVRLVFSRRLQTIETTMADGPGLRALRAILAQDASAPNVITTSSTPFWGVAFPRGQDALGGVVVPLQFTADENWSADAHIGTARVAGLRRHLTRFGQLAAERMNRADPALLAHTPQCMTVPRWPEFPIVGRSLELSLLVGAVTTMARVDLGGPVFASALIEPDGSLGPVQGLAQKAQAWLRELGPGCRALLTAAQRDALGDLALQFQIRVVDHLRDVVAYLLERDDFAHGLWLRADRPFRGLSSFGPEHAEMFFGREEESARLAERIVAHPWVTVTGPSGGGKTSLLQAGVLPRLTAWHGLVLRPGHRPDEGLRSALNQWIDHQPTVENIAAHCRTSGQGLVVIVDQGEEIFTLCSDPDRRTAFAETLAGLAAHGTGLIRVVYSLRDDFLVRLNDLTPIRQLYTSQLVVVSTPDRNALVRTLEAPANTFDACFEEGLVDEMVDAVAGEPAALALLQFCADQMWRDRPQGSAVLTRDSYLALGGVEGALAAHADRVYDALPPGQQVAARELLLGLVTTEETRTVCRRRDMTQATFHHQAAVVLDQLITARLLVSTEGDEPGETNLELVHEALIQKWTRLRDWLDADREGHRTLQALRAAAKEWNKRGRPKALLWRDELLEEYRVWRRRSQTTLTATEETFSQISEAEDRRARRLRRTLMTAALVVVTAFSGFLYVQWVEANEQRAVAEQQTEEAREQRAYAEQQRNEAQKQSAAAEHARNKATVSTLLANARLLENQKKTYAALALFRAALKTELGQIKPTPNRIDHLHGSVITESFVALSRRSNMAQHRIVTHTGNQPVAISPTADYIIVPSNQKLAVMDLRSGRDVYTLPVAGIKKQICISPDGHQFVVTTDDEAMLISNIRKGAISRKFRLGDKVDACTFSTDGKLLAMVSENKRGTIHIWDLAAGNLLYKFDHADLPSDTSKLKWYDEYMTSPALCRPSFSSDGKTFANECGKTTGIWSLADGKLIYSTYHDAMKDVVRLSPDHKQYAHLFSSRDSVNTLHVETILPPGRARKARSFNLEDFNAGQIRFSANGAYVSAHSHSGFKVWRTGDPSSPVLAKKAYSHDRATAFSSVPYSPLGAVSIGSDIEVFSFKRVPDDVRKRFEAPEFSRPTVMVFHASSDQLSGADVDHMMFSNDENQLIAKADGLIEVWNIHRPRARFGDMWDYTISADARRFATSTRTGSILVWNVQSGERIHSIKTPRGASILLSRNGARLATHYPHFRQNRKEIVVWNVDNGQMIHRFMHPEAVRRDIVFSPNGTYLATSTGRNKVFVWNVDSGGLLRTFESKTGINLYFELAFSPDSKLLATTTRKGKIIVWAVDSGKAIQLLGADGRMDRLTFSPNGSLIAAGIDTMKKSSVIVWNVKTGQKLHNYPGLIAQHLRFSPDGKHLAIDGRIVNMESGRVLHHLKHTGSVKMLAFSPNSKLLATACSKRKVYVWDTETGTLLQELPLTKDAQEIAFSRDGFRLSIAEGEQLRNVRVPGHRPEKLVLHTGELTNYRVCKDTFKVVPVIPFPPAETVWAPPGFCAETGQKQAK